MLEIRYPDHASLSNRKVQAIKEFRHITRCGLKETKEIFDEFQDKEGKATIEDPGLARVIKNHRNELRSMGVQVEVPPSRTRPALISALYTALDEEEWEVAESIIDIIKMREYGNNHVKPQAY